MEGDPSREELLAMLSGQGYSGGAKKRVPKGLKSWLAFRKKHPNMTIKQQSRAYHARRGKGIEEDDMEGGAGFESDIEGGRRRRRTKKKGTRKRRGRGMDGGEFEGGAFGDPSTVPSGTDAWMTKNLKKTNAMLALGKKIFEMSKRAFPDEYKKAQRTARGYGVSFQDFVRFAKSPDNAADSGSALRKKWNALFPSGPVENFATENKAKVEQYYTPREVVFIQVGNDAAHKLLKSDNIRLIEEIEGAEEAE